MWLPVSLCLTAKEFQARKRVATQYERNFTGWDVVWWAAPSQQAQQPAAATVAESAGTERRRNCIAGATNAG